MATYLTQKTYLQLASVAAITIGIVFYYIDRDVKVIDNQNSVINNTLKTNEIIDTEKTLTDAWQWQAFPNIEQNKLKETDKIFDKHYNTVIDPKYLYRVLQDVKLDENGDVILDHAALQALGLTLNRGRLRLDRTGLAELQEMIKKGLSGKAGEQTASVVGDFYNYLDAKDEMGLYQQDPTTQSEQRQQYKELVALRGLYLTDEVAHSLFSQTDANAEYMFNMLELDSNSQISDIDKQKLRVKYSENLVSEMVTIFDWSERYQSFKADKNRALNRGNNVLSKLDKDQLLAQHFTQEEIQELTKLNITSML